MKIYIALDGDGVGTKLSALIESKANDNVISHFAHGVANEMIALSKNAELIGGKTILCAGDSVLISIDSSKISDVLRLLKDCKFSTYSGGTGRTIKEAALNLQYAKLNGKNQTWHFQKEKPLWLKLRIENRFFSLLSKYSKGHF